MEWRMQFLTKTGIPFIVTLTRMKEQLPVHTIELGASHDFSMWGHRKEEIAREVPHRHDYYEIILFFEGGGTQAIDFVNYPNARGTVYFIKTGQVHMMNRAKHSSGCNFRFQRSYFFNDETGAAAFSREYPFFSLQSDQPVLKLPDEVFEILKSLITVYSDAAGFVSQDALKAIVRSILHIIKTPFEQSLSLPQAPGHLQKFMMLVLEHFYEKRNVSDYAEMLNLSPNYLNELCSEKLGVTAKSLIDEQVMLEVKRLLFHTELSVKEIAFRLNFEDPSYFVRRFKEKTGVTPVAFRSRSRR